ncbi:hypothetical protein [Halobellus rufus]|uniref:hypothetical protein n=1 Tax=Halobellus rufus TaxID=1448860 RepID=UPI000679C690|nr:hypothetical protein [Halobellus rufus]
MVEVRLASNAWTRVGNATARGLAFDADDRAVDPAEAFDGCDSPEAVAEVADRLSGFFAAVVRGSDADMLVCDVARSIPLYFTTGRPTAIGDVALELEPERPSAYDPTAASEFALTRYVTCGETLRDDIETVRAGEVVTVPRGPTAGFERSRYAEYRPTTAADREPADCESADPDSPTRAELLDSLASTMARVFDRVVRVADGRPVLVPLSGGWDSRLVAAELVARDVEVVGFTFGAHGHGDVEVSRDIASALGIDWEWVEYTTDRWYDWYHSPARRRYHEYAFNLDSLPFLAEWPAVAELLERGDVPEDALVCPGHTVATPSERVPDAWVAAAEEGTRGDAPTTADVVEHVLDTHYSLWEWSDAGLRERFADRIESEAGLTTVRDATEAAAAYERWEWATRMTTFTNGDCRLYEWFGLDWWLPLWDRDYVDFWASVPLAHRHEKALQREYARKRVAEVGDDAAAVANRTDRDWTPVDQVRRTFETRPEKTHTEQGDPQRTGFEAWLGTQDVAEAAVESRGNYPLRWYGVFPAEAESRFDPAKNLYALRTLAALGLLSFDPPRSDVPLTEPLSLPPV